MSIRIAVVAGVCFALAGCGHQDLDIANDNVVEGPDESIPGPLEGPDQMTGRGVLLDGTLRVVDFAEVEEGYIIDGDLLVAREQIRVLNDGEDVSSVQSALMSRPLGARWPNAKIPFEFDANVSPEMRDLVRAAMAVWENNTQINFVRRDGQDAFLRIKAWDGSYSYAGGAFTGGKQYVVIQRSAVGKSWGRGLVIHELGHAMGLKHEQQRVDRDDSVTIHWDNIEDGKKSNFFKYDPGVILTSYNIGSIMHYGSFAFSRNGRPTITRTKDGSTFRQNYGIPTERDFSGVRQLYTFTQ